MADPATTAALINAGSNVLGRALSSPPNQSSASSRNTFDSSGWSVALNGGHASASGSSASAWPWVAVGAGFIALAVFARMLRR